MWADSVKSCGQIAIMAKDPESFWELVDDEPMVDAHADRLPVFVSSAIGVVYPEKLIRRFSATRALAAVVLYDRAPMSAGPLGVVIEILLAPALFCRSRLFY
jgi:hypothetical protein